MIRKLPVKVAAAAAGVMLAGGVAAASSPPEAADKGLATGEEHAGFEVPSSKEAHPTKDDHPTGAADDIASEEDEAVGEADEASEEEGGGPVDNHGAEVSDVAHNTTATGRDKGAAVSEVARDGHGAAPQAGQGSGNAGGHGKP